jgi:hypothetical protein
MAILELEVPAGGQIFFWHQHNGGQIAFRLVGALLN